MHYGGGGRFGTLVSRTGGAEEESWKQVCMSWRRSMQECKGKFLATQVTNPDLWKSYLVQEVRTLTRRGTKRLNKTRFYAGELRRLHGEEEFECMAAEGKLIKVEDSDGDECFEKVMRSEIQEVEDSRQARNSKSGRISQNNYDDLGEAVSTELMDAKIKKCKTVDLPLEDCIPEESAQ